MRLNENTVLHGKKVVLVPYRREHVEVYHEWMKSTYLQQTTASEPLTLEEEYEMQKSWHLDDDKCTFIVLTSKFKSPRANANFEQGGMIGDVNLFLLADDSPETELFMPRSVGKYAEIEIMIAEPAARRQGYAQEALEMMMSYGCDNIGIKNFIAKIQSDNDPSIKLFEKIGFRFAKHCEAFKETWLIYTK